MPPIIFLAPHLKMLTRALLLFEESHAIFLCRQIKKSGRIVIIATSLPEYQGEIAIYLGLHSLVGNQNRNILQQYIEK